jgi:shikimate dehydrogenase
MVPSNPGMPVELDRFPDLRCVFDMVYTPKNTELLEAAAGRGLETIGGIEMLLNQGVEQFRLFTGQEIGIEVFRGAVL